MSLFKSMSPLKLMLKSIVATAIALVVLTLAILARVNDGSGMQHQMQH